MIKYGKNVGKLGKNRKKSGNESKKLKILRKSIEVWLTLNHMSDMYEKSLIRVNIQSFFDSDHFRGRHLTLRCHTLYF